MRLAPLSKQRGAATMLIALLVLMSLAIIGISGTRLVMTQHRMSGNSARSDAAFAAAEAGIQNALAYLRPNRSVMAAPGSGGWLNGSNAIQWVDCNSSNTTLPCGNGTSNLYGNTWKYFGPVPNQSLAAMSGTYAYDVSTWYLSNSLTQADLDFPSPVCTTLGLNAALPAVTTAAMGLVNTLLGTLGPLLGQPGLQLQSSMCLPLNFSTMPNGTRASAIHPSITIVAAATSTDPAGGAATVQQVVAMTNLFNHLPPAALMVNGTAGLNGDIRIWGNPRPPTESPMDFSLLKLNDVAGLNVTSLLSATVGTAAGGIATSLNLSFAPVLNVTAAQVTAFDWDVTFPLSIWSASATSFGNTSYTIGGILSNARTCDPPYGGAPSSACVPLSQSVTALYLLVTRNVQLHLPDVQDPSNIASTVAGLIGSSVPAFPADLFDFTFGYPSAQSSRIQSLATAAANCSAISTQAFYWVTGDCALSGAIGTAAAPVVIVATGNLTLAGGTDFYGVIYLQGSSAKTMTGSAAGARPTIHGAVLSEGALTGSSNFNVVYDPNAIRKAGFRSGAFMPVPGGWNDATTGP